MDDKRDFIRNQSCLVCGYPPPSDPAHIKTRGAGASNLEYEMIPLCRPHHVEQGTKPWSDFVKKYPQVKVALIEKGWEFIDNFGAEKLVFTGTSHWEKVEDY